MGKHHRYFYNFPEEHRPGPVSEFRFLTAQYGDTIRKPAAGTRVERAQRSPWWVVVWEPLTTKVPGPAIAQPYCCYVRTVVFYVRGYIVRPFGYLYQRGSKWAWEKPGARYEQWAQLEHTFRFDDLIEFEGETFEVSGGRVTWYQKRWWFVSVCRRKEKKM